MTLRRRDNGRTQPLDATHTETTDHGTYCNVPYHVRLAMFRSKEEDDDEGSNDEDRGKDQKARSKEEFLEFGDGRHGLFFWAVEGDDDRTDDG